MSSPTKSTTTTDNFSSATSLVDLPEYDLLPSYTPGYEIPKQPQARVHTSPPPRYEERHLTAKVFDADEAYRLTGYGEISVFERYGAVETGGDESGLRILQPGHARRCARHQTTETVPGPVSKSDSDDPDEPLLTGDVR